MRIGALKTLIIISLLLSFFQSCAEEKAKSPIIVRIGTETLTVDDLRMTLPADAREKMTRDDIREHVRSWMNNQILYQEGIRKGFGKDIRIQKRVDHYRTRLIGSAYIDMHLSQNIALADTAIQTYYDENFEDFTRQNDEVYLHHILMPTKKEADSVYNLIRWRKQPFDTMAQKIASIQGRDDSEWNLGYIPRGVLLDKLYNAVVNRRVGLLTRAIETDFGFHLLQVRDKKRKGTVRELDEVRDEIIARLQHISRNERYRQHLSLLKNGATIETNFQLIDSMPLDSLVSTIKPPTLRE
ncbi:MAG: hypothetical protein DWQ05_03590 [Calditrichaeota bacterium]|nr:MAG: hypothetical protein DWQ05_03590 [Calditrichota bacterium]